MCEYCLSGEEQFCKKGAVYTYNVLDYEGNHTYGGYSSQIVVDEEYVVRIPDALGLDVAAQLLCAGITTYSALKHWNASSGMKVAIIGMGGLGHLGVQIAHAMGASVTVLSQGENKREEAFHFGAHHYYATCNQSTFTELAGMFDLILNTVSTLLDIDAYLSLLGVGGTLVNVGLPAEPVSFNAFSILARKNLTGSSISGIRETQEMLDFCAEHRIVPQI